MAGKFVGIRLSGSERAALENRFGSVNAGLRAFAQSCRGERSKVYSVRMTVSQMRDLKARCGTVTKGIRLAVSNFLAGGFVDSGPEPCNTEPADTADLCYTQTFTAGADPWH